VVLVGLKGIEIQTRWMSSKGQSCIILIAWDVDNKFAKNKGITVRGQVTGTALWLNHDDSFLHSLDPTAPRSVSG
jgi:hypothetical protein